MRFLLFVFLVSNIFLFACTSGKKALKRGDYERAVILAIERLRKNNDHDKSVETLKQAYPLYIENQQEKLDNLEKSPDMNKWDDMVAIYQSVNNIADQIRVCTPARQMIANPQRYDDELAHATKMASENHYQAGMRFWENPTRENAKKAYFEFQKCNNFTKNYRGEVAQLLLETKEKATIKIKLEIQNPPSPLSAERLNTEILRELDELNNKDFIRFYTPRMITKTGENPQFSDQVLQISFFEFFVGDVQYQNRTERRIDSTAREVMVNNQRQVVYDKFYADVNIRSKTLLVRGSIDVNIKDNQNGSTLYQNRTPYENTWRNEWGTFQGDARALNDYHRKITQAKEQVNPTRIQSFNSFCDTASPEVRKGVRNFYQNF